MLAPINLLRLKLILTFLILIIYTSSCINQTSSIESNPNNRINPVDTLARSSNLFFTEYDTHKINEDDSLENIVTQTIRNISLNTSHSILEKELEAIYFRDQVFRDSAQLHSKNADENREFRKKMKQSDKVNQKIIFSIFEKYGWVDTRKMSKAASKGIWITIIHCNRDKDFNIEALKYLNIAFKEDSIITNQIYATAADRIYSRLEGRSIYGTSAYFGIKKEYDRSTIDEFNKQRKLIGLSNYLQEDGYY